MTSRYRTLSVVGAALLLLTFLWAFVSPSGDGEPADAADDGTECNAQQTVANALNVLGFDQDELNFEGDFDLSLPGINDSGANSFVENAITTSEELSEFLQDESDASAAVREYLEEELPSSEFERALSGEGWVGVQMLSPVIFEGNTSFVDGERHDAGQREVPTGELWWFYVDEDCNVLENVAIRAACGNPQLSLPEPQPEPEPEPTPTPTPTPEEECPPGEVPHEGRCIKEESSDDELLNELAPETTEPQGDEMQPPEDEQQEADEAPPEPPTDDERGTAADVEEEPEPEPEETAPAAQDEGGSPGGSTDPDGEHTSNEQPEEEQGVNNPDTDAGSTDSEESFDEEEPAEGDASEEGCEGFC